MSHTPAANRRRYERIDLTQSRWLACHTVGEGQHLDGAVSVISSGGMFIRSSRIHPIGTRLEVKMRNIADVVEADCVVRNHVSDGFGVEFVEIRPKFRDNLERILSRLRTA